MLLPDGRSIPLSLSSTLELTRLEVPALHPTPSDAPSLEDAARSHALSILFFLRRLSEEGAAVYGGTSRKGGYQDGRRLRRLAAIELDKVRRYQSIVAGSTTVSDISVDVLSGTKHLATADHSSHCVELISRQLRSCKEFLERNPSSK